MICQNKSLHNIGLKNSPEESYGLNDMVHNYYLEEARKKTQGRNKNFKPREMPSARTHNTPNDCKPKPRSNNQKSKNWHASKSSDVTLKAMQKAYYYRNSISYSDSKHFVCSTCQKCIFNANHDAYVTKFLKEVNSHAKDPSHKTRNNNKPVEQKRHTQKPFKPRTIMSTEVPTTDMIVMKSMTELESLFGHLFDEYLNGENQVVSKSSVVTTVDASNKRQQQSDSTLSTSTLGPIVTADGNFNLHELALEQSQQGASNDVLAETGLIHIIRITELIPDIEDSHHGTSDAMHNPSQPLKVSQKILVSFLMEINMLSIDFLTPS
ncbi:hypothetical protein Tco_0673758 [Tanacetum coccineum]